MSIYPDHKTFRTYIAKVADGLERGIYPDYNHSNGCTCVVGKALEDFRGEPTRAGESHLFLSKINDDRLNELFTTYKMYDDVQDQKEGAIKARKYLAETADLELV